MQQVHSPVKAPDRSTCAAVDLAGRKRVSGVETALAARTLDPGVSIGVIGLAALVPHHIIETKNPPGMSICGAGSETRVSCTGSRQQSEVPGLLLTDLLGDESVDWIKSL